jgi:3-deoxy-D-manno-octulosonic-acid transferase
MLFYFLYNLVLFTLIVLLSPLWLFWMACTPKIRAGFGEKLGHYRPEFVAQLIHHLPIDNRIWLHAVSVGELNAARPLIDALLEKGFPVMISNTTATGHALARKTYPTLPVFYFPLDLPGVLEKSLKLLKPKLLVVLETEIWPNLMVHCRRHRVPVLLVNGRLSQRSYKGYATLSWFFKWVLNHFTGLMMQSQADAKRIIALGTQPGKVSVGGNLKFDMPALDNTEQVAMLSELFAFPKHAPVLVFASTHKGEDELFIKMFEDLHLDFPDLRAVIAPRHPERFTNVATLLMGRGTHFVRRSQLTEVSPNTAQNPVIILDSIGELNAVFRLGTVACMGGTFVDWGGHNPLEPINAQIPVVFGLSMENFQVVADRVLEAHAGFQAKTIHEAEQQIRELLTRPEYYDHIVRNGQKLMAENRGVAESMATKIEAMLQHRVTAVTN